MADLMQSQLAGLLSFIRAWGKLTTRPGCPGDMHEECLELERQGLIRRLWERDGRVGWAALPRVFCAHAGLYVRGEPLPPGSLEMGIVGMMYYPDDGKLEFYHTD